MAENVNLTTDQDIVVLKVTDENIKLRINEENIILKVSGQGPSGTPGATIETFYKSGSDGLLDTYTLRMTDGRTFTFQVKNGEKGDPGEDGEVAVIVVDEEELMIINPDIDNYEGDYTVTPTTNLQTLDTQGLLMQNDVNVKEIPYSEVSNEKGGFTATIGG